VIGHDTRKMCLNPFILNAFVCNYVKDKARPLVVTCCFLGRLHPVKPRARLEKLLCVIVIIIFINNNDIAVTNLPVLLLLLKFIFVDCVQTLQWEHLTRAKELCIYSTEVQKVFIPNHPSGSMPDSFHLWSSRCGPLATLYQLEWTWTSMATRTW